MTPPSAGRGSRAVRAVTSDGILFGSRVKDLSQLANDDELAAEEAAAQRGVLGEQEDVAGSNSCRIFINSTVRQQDIAAL